MNETFKPFQQVLVIADGYDKWMASFYSHYDKEENAHMLTNGAICIDCIPYEGNEHLVGTTDAPNTFSKTEATQTLTINIPEDCIASWNMTTNSIEFIKTNTKRWRAKYGKFYWYILPSGEPYKLQEANTLLDNKYYECGNYFQTKEEAENKAKIFKQILKEEKEEKEFDFKYIDKKIKELKWELEKIVMESEIRKNLYRLIEEYDIACKKYLKDIL